MDNSTQYELVIQNNTVSSESGFFYKAAPFVISTPSGEFQCNFQKGPKGKVVYSLIKDGVQLDHLTHPDYVPELSPGKYKAPESLSADEKLIFAAMVKLDVSQDKSYKTYFDLETLSPPVSFTVTQSSFLT